MLALLFSLTCLCSIYLVSPSSQILLRSFTIFPQASDTFLSLHHLLSSSPSSDPTQFIVQFRSPFESAKREDLERMLGDCAPFRFHFHHNGFLVYCSEVALSRFVRAMQASGDSSLIAWIGRYHPAFKLSPSLQDIQLNAWDEVSVITSSSSSFALAASSSSSAFAASTSLIFRVPVHVSSASDLGPGFLRTDPHISTDKRLLAPSASSPARSFVFDSKHHDPALVISLLLASDQTAIDIRRASFLSLVASRWSTELSASPSVGQVQCRVGGSARVVCVLKNGECGNKSYHFPRFPFRSPLYDLSSCRLFFRI